VFDQGKAGSMDEVFYFQMVGEGVDVPPQPSGQWQVERAANADLPRSRRWPERGVAEHAAIPAIDSANPFRIESIESFLGQQIAEQETEEQMESDLVSQGHRPIEASQHASEDFDEDENYRKTFLQRDYFDFVVSVIVNPMKAQVQELATNPTTVSNFETNIANLTTNPGSPSISMAEVGTSHKTDEDEWVMVS